MRNRAKGRRELVAELQVLRDRVAALERENARLRAEPPASAGADGSAVGTPEHRQAVESLRTSERKLSNAMKIARLGYWEYDTATNLFTFDDHFYALFRTSAEAVGGYNMTPDEYCRRYMHPDDVPLVAEETRKAMETTDPNYSRQFEHRIRYADGESGFIVVRFFILKDAQGRTIKTYGANQDVTERHRDEERLRIAKQRAEAANEAKSQFLANMSHEIRTPMTAILGFTEILLDQFLADDRTPAEQIDAVQTIRRNGEHLLDLINCILDLAKIEAGKCTVERVPCSPGQLIAEVASLMQVRAGSTGVELKLEREAPLPDLILIDPLRLRQILINVVGNAFKFTERGSVTLRTRLDTQRSLLAFDVIDTGVGMTSAQAATLFRPFTQVDATATRKFGGTGLGLTISRRLAQLLGGDVRLVQTAPGHGAHFRITVAVGLPERGLAYPCASPAAADESYEDASATESETASLPGRRILLAEDGPDNQRLIAYILRKAGAAVTIAGDGRDAIDMALQAAQDGTPFDAILMDVQMPVMDGCSATRALRDRGYRGLIVALTANAMEADREQCLHAGCDDFTTKPIKRRELIDTLRRGMAAPARLDTQS